MSLFYIMPIVFLIGVIMIALEDVIRINKAATAVGMCILLWVMFLLDATGIFSAHKPEFMVKFIDAFPHFASLSTAEQAFRYIEFSMTEALGDVSTTLFFVLGSMVIIEVLDSHGAFGILSHSIKTTAKRKLLWILSFITFFLSMLLGNLATIIIMIAVMRKLMANKEDRILFACMGIIAANAGGSCSPIGDVTTLLLWTGGNLTASHQISHIFLPCLTTLVAPLTVLTFTIAKDAHIQVPQQTESNTLPEDITPKFQKTLLFIGLATLAMVPVFQSLIGLPPFMGVLLGVVVLWSITDLRYAKFKDKNHQHLKISNLFARIDLATILFFLGILMSVNALNASGFLTTMSGTMTRILPEPNSIAAVLGICSSFLDNVALVAAAMGMYPIADAGVFASNGTFWTFLAYCAVTGGSILIIGSATGVTAMGMEKISFGYYLKKFTPLAFLGFAVGAAVFLLLF
ncbi:MAG: sodium:proton antiporter NhaD [Bacteroidales bacterium]|nr:sodium:proton antiporter NhaD [Bacteroidales bacterium]